MRILLLTNNLWAGGKERRLVALIKGFLKYPDIELHLVTFSDRIHYKEIFELGVPITILKRVPKQNPLVFYRFFKLCKKWKPDLIHSWSSMSSIWAIPTSSLLRIKLINGNIADAPSGMNIFDKRLFRARLTFPFSNVIVGNSLAGLDAYNVPKSKRVCIYNGFDINRISNLEEEQTIREKFAIYQRMIPDKFASRFVFTGLQINVESIVNIFDIGVLSTYSEGISNAILEYMALEKPTVATLGGGTVETIENGKTGFLIPQASPQTMVDKLNYLLENESEMKKMGMLAKQRLESVFGIQNMMNAYYELYVKTNKS